MIWDKLPEIAEQRCYGCNCVVGVAKFRDYDVCLTGDFRDHDVCLMMTAEEQIEYLSPDVIHKILTTKELREEFWARVEVEFEDRTQLQELLSKIGPTFPDEQWVLQNIDKIEDHGKDLYSSYKSGKGDSWL